MKIEEYTFLCSVIVINNFQQLLFEETFIVGVDNVSESDAFVKVMHQLNNIQHSLSKKMNRLIFLSCHCLYPMPNEISVETLSDDSLILMFPGLREWIIR